MTPISAWYWRHSPPVVEKPPRDQLLGIEGLEERALALAASLSVDPHARQRSRSALPRFEDNARRLREAYGVLAGDGRAGRFATAAADELVDNFHVVSRGIQCGWLQDKFGLSWQVVPAGLPELLRHPAAMRAMLGMVKLNLAALQNGATA
ncbi:MAG TPA: VOC family protein [Terriglobales bacterium]|nr:VOC family protein [Terriglobales bacterium]